MSIDLAKSRAPHLATSPMPRWLGAAVGELGQAEINGAKSNPRILAYRREADCALAGDDGQVPWCAIFVNAMLARVGVTGSGSAMARSFANSPHFERLAAPMVGAITVISSNRGPATGHVFFYAGENGLMFLGLGGNQNDAVGLDFFKKDKLVGHFWPKGAARPPAPFDRPFRLPRPLLPHERKAARDV